LTVNCKLGYLLITYIMEKTIMIEQTDDVKTCCKETCCADGCCSDIDNCCN